MHDIFQFVCIVADVNYHPQGNPTGKAEAQAKPEQSPFSKPCLQLQSPSSGGHDASTNIELANLKSCQPWSISRGGSSPAWPGKNPMTGTGKLPLCQHCRATAHAKDQRCHKTKEKHKTRDSCQGGKKGRATHEPAAFFWHCMNVAIFWQFANTCFSLACLSSFLC